MKKILLTAVFIFACAVLAGEDGTAAALAQEPAEVWAKQQNIIYLNCAGLIFADQIFVSYIRAITPALSLGANIFLSRNESTVMLLISPPVYPEPTYTFGAGLSADYHIENHAPNGLYFGCGVNTSYTLYDYPDGLSGSISWVGNAHMGYRWIFDWGGSVNVQAALNIDTANGDYIPYFIGNNLNIGWAF